MPVHIGDLVVVSQHRQEGYGWTVGAVGSIKCQAHERDFDRLHITKTPAPPLKPGWWIVSVEHKKARGGYALAQLPEEFLAPHACTSRCPRHRCLAG